LERVRVRRLVVPQGGAAYLHRGARAPETCEERTPSTYRNVAVRKVGPGGSFDVARWRGPAGVAYEVTAEAGVLGSTQPGDSAY
jgi:hypothetical protein